jgi:hypothetical protein
MADDCLFYGHLVSFTATWYILLDIWYFLLAFGTFSPFWYVVHTKINLATLLLPNLPPRTSKDESIQLFAPM